MYDDNNRCTAPEGIPPQEWVVYTGTKEYARGWAHVLIDRPDSSHVLVCCHPQPREDMVLDIVLHCRRTSIQAEAPIAEQLATRMRYFDPRSAS